MPTRSRRYSCRRDVCRKFKIPPMVAGKIETLPQSNVRVRAASLAKHERRVDDRRRGPGDLDSPGDGVDARADLVETDLVLAHGASPSRRRSAPSASSTRRSTSASQSGFEPGVGYGQ